MIHISAPVIQFLLIKVHIYFLFDKCVLCSVFMQSNRVGQQHMKVSWFLLYSFGQTICLPELQHQTMDICLTVSVLVSKCLHPFQSDVSDAVLLPAQTTMPTTVSVLRMVQLLSRRLLLWRPTRTPLECSLQNNIYTYNQMELKHYMSQFHKVTGIFQRQSKVCLRQCYVNKDFKPK